MNLSQIAPYFVLMLNDTIALEHEKVNQLATVSLLKFFTFGFQFKKRHCFQVEFKVKVLGTPKPSLQWFKDDLEVDFFFGQDDSSGRCHSTPLLRFSAAIGWRSRMRRTEGA